MPRLERKEKQFIIDYLTDESKHWTLIGISNNPNFAKKCDRVIVLQNGDIIADAPFENIKKDELMCELFKLPHPSTH
jgi:ABC-type bacteriocin/lantibiotic exporter with double-glycine peptidase domain